MSKILIITAVAVLSFFNANATNLETNLNNTTSVEIKTDDLVEIFDWTVKTTTGEFSGTAASLFDAKRRANIVGQGAIVLEQKITSYFVLKNEMQSKSNRVYYWEVKSEKGHAQGFSSNELDAKRMINLITKGSIVSYQIIKSKNRK